MADARRMGVIDSGSGSDVSPSAFMSACLLKTKSVFRRKIGCNESSPGFPVKTSWPDISLASGSSVGGNTDSMMGASVITGASCVGSPGFDRKRKNQNPMSMQALTPPMMSFSFLERLFQKVRRLCPMLRMTSLRLWSTAGIFWSVRERNDRVVGMEVSERDGRMIF